MGSKDDTPETLASEDRLMTTEAQNIGGVVAAIETASGDVQLATASGQTTANSTLTQIRARLPTRKRVTASWTAEDGTSHIALDVGASGELWDLVAVCADLSAYVTASTYTLHIGEGSTFTADSRADRYTSSATAVASAITDRLPSAMPFQLDTNGKLHLIVEPDAGTTTGDIDLDFELRPTAV